MVALRMFSVLSKLYIRNEGEEMYEIINIEKIDFQLFSGEKTEKATPKRRSEARKKGQVRKSSEINSAIVLLLTFMVLKYYLPYILNELQNFTRTTYMDMWNVDLNLNTVHNLTMQVIILGGKLVGPIMAAALLAGLVTNYMQVGFMFSTDPLMPKFDKINPLSGFKRIVSLRSVVEMFKSISKLIIIGYVTFSVISSNFYIFPQMLDMNIFAAIAIIGQISYKIVFRAAIALIVLAVIDFIYQRYEFEKSIKMSKQEVKEEYKLMEGDPQVKGKIKERQRLMSQRRMMQDVPKADVVITNPTHFAIAIKYDGKVMAAPVVIAKGVDDVAQKIKEIAKENKVVTVENRPLAQALYKTVEIGFPVPPELFQAVAEVLAFVYRLKGKV